METRLPVERRVDVDTGVEMARCRQNGGCRAWKPLDQFSPWVVRNNVYYCKNCQTEKKRKYEDKVAFSGSLAQKLVRVVKSREKVRGSKVYFTTKDIEALLDQHGSKCCVSGKRENLTIGRRLQDQPLNKDNAVVLTRLVERRAYAGDKQLIKKLLASSAPM